MLQYSMTSSSHTAIDSIFIASFTGILHISTQIRSKFRSCRERAFRCNDRMDCLLHYCTRKVSSTFCSLPQTYLLCLIDGAASFPTHPLLIKYDHPLFLSPAFLPPHTGASPDAIQDGFQCMEHLLLTAMASCPARFPVHIVF